jgi:hypothetical protein
MKERLEYIGYLRYERGLKWCLETPKINFIEDIVSEAYIRLNPLGKIKITIEEVE